MIWPPSKNIEYTDGSDFVLFMFLAFFVVAYFPKNDTLNENFNKKNGVETLNT